MPETISATIQPFTPKLSITQILRGVRNSSTTGFWRSLVADAARRLVDGDIEDLNYYLRVLSLTPEEKREAYSYAETIGLSPLDEHAIYTVLHHLGVDLSL
jgi:hypothetical protein